MKERPWESVEGEKRAQERTQRSPKASRRSRERILERDSEKVPPGGQEGNKKYEASQQTGKSTFQVGCGQQNPVLSRDQVRSSSRSTRGVRTKRTFGQLGRAGSVRAGSRSQSAEEQMEPTDADNCFPKFAFKVEDSMPRFSYQWLENGATRRAPLPLLH